MLSLLPRWLWEFQIEETQIKQAWTLATFQNSSAVSAVYHPSTEFLEKLEISSCTYLDLLVQEDTQA